MPDIINACGLIAGAAFAAAKPGETILLFGFDLMSL